MKRYPAPLQDVSFSGQASMLLPVMDLDWSRLYAMRQMISETGKGPCYMLAPEIAVLLSYMHDLRERCFFETLWNTGARPNEALALTPRSFDFDAPQPYVTLPTLKQRTRRPGRPMKSAPPVRTVTLWDADYRARMKTLISTFALKRDELIWPGRQKADKSFTPISTDTVSRWLNRAIDAAMRDGVTFSVSPLTPKTFRHSFAMHILFNRVHPRVLQALMGHQSYKSTEVYTQLFLFDVAGQHDVNFSFNPDLARQLVGGRNI
ncbi:phage integrase family protein [Grimontella sp. AG753]|nr:phage integrase family protein [Grimontella sp. AG753]